MSRLRVVTWNAEGMFVEGTKTRRASPHDALDVLKNLDADILVIPEFGRLADLKDEIATAISALGYELVSLAYDEPRTPGLGFVMLSRLPIHETIVHSLAHSKRQLLELVCEDEVGTRIHVFGVHLDDRSESGRLMEAEAVSEIIHSRAGQCILLLGDFNAMREDSWFARIARSRLAHGVSRRLSHEVLRSMAERVQEMALGTTVAYLVAHTELHDLDPGRKRTISSKQAGLEWVPSWRLAKIDWVFASSQITSLRYRVMKDVGSDHRPVWADIEIIDSKQ